MTEVFDSTGGEIFQPNHGCKDLDVLGMSPPTLSNFHWHQEPSFLHLGRIGCQVAIAGCRLCPVGVLKLPFSIGMRPWLLYQKPDFLLSPRLVEEYLH